MKVTSHRSPDKEPGIDGKAARKAARKMARGAEHGAACGAARKMARGAERGEAAEEPPAWATAMLAKMEHMQE